ncbi:hypothetical protein PJN45_29180, partial [Mycobacterium kansasii]
NRNKPSKKESKSSKKAKSGKKKKRHWLRTILTIIVVIIAVMIGFFVYGYQRGVKHEGSVAKQEKFTSLKNSDGSVNILLLG